MYPARSSAVCYPLGTGASSPGPFRLSPQMAPEREGEGRPEDMVSGGKDSFCKLTDLLGNPGNAASFQLGELGALPAPL